MDHGVKVADWRPRNLDSIEGDQPRSPCFFVRPVWAFMAKQDQTNGFGILGRVSVWFVWFVWFVWLVWFVPVWEML